MVIEIRIAEGVYKPDQGEGAVNGDHNSAFDLVNNVTLTGGYAGLGAPDPNAHNFERFESILSGDLLGNDGPNFTNYGDNSWRVIRATGLDDSTLVRGLTLAASARENQEPLYGGGIFCTAGGVTVEDCRLQLNRAYRGAAVAVVEGAITLRRCLFIGNLGDFGCGHFDIAPEASALIEDCLFENNRSFDRGGALNADSGTLIRRCIFTNNIANDGGSIGNGGTIEDCVFIGNHADYGGAVSGGGSYRRCRFIDNDASSSGGAYSNVIVGSLNHARFVDCDFIDNRSGTDDGGAAYGGAAFINCRFLGNHSGASGGGPFAPGGAIETHAAETLIAGCTFSGNSSSAAAGAIDIRPGTIATIDNCSFAANSAVGAGAAVRGAATICNSVFGPHAGTLLSGVASVDYSCLPIAWTGGGGTGNIVAADPGFVSPLGPDGIAGTEDDDLRLRPDSLCIDAGNSNVLPPDTFDIDGDGNVTEPLPLDAFGNARILEMPGVPNTGIPPLNGGPAVIDIGAHEYRRPADIAPSIGDGAININDLLEVIIHWGPCPAVSMPCPGDIDGNGEVAVWDLIQVVINWG
jgi:predicted outer membrane repeat protein